jgi:hypothetical protein
LILVSRHLITLSALASDISTRAGQAIGHPGLYWIKGGYYDDRDRLDRLLLRGWLLCLK